MSQGIHVKKVEICMDIVAHTKLYCCVIPDFVAQVNEDLNLVLFRIGLIKSLLAGPSTNGFKQHFWKNIFGQKFTHGNIYSIFQKQYTTLAM